MISLYVQLRVEASLSCLSRIRLNVSARELGADELRQVFCDAISKGSLFPYTNTGETFFQLAQMAREFSLDKAVAYGEEYDITNTETAFLFVKRARGADKYTLSMYGSVDFPPLDSDLMLLNSIISPLNNALQQKLHVDHDSADKCSMLWKGKKEGDVLVPPATDCGVVHFSRKCEHVVRFATHQIVSTFPGNREREGFDVHMSFLRAPTRNLFDRVVGARKELVVSIEVTSDRIWPEGSNVDVSPKERGLTTTRCSMSWIQNGRDQYLESPAINFERYRFSNKPSHRYTEERRYSYRHSGGIAEEGDRVIMDFLTYVGKNMQDATKHISSNVVENLRNDYFDPEANSELTCNMNVVALKGGDSRDKAWNTVSSDPAKIREYGYSKETVDLSDFLSCSREQQEVSLGL